MNKKAGENLAAVIDIGSNLIKMRVTELQKGDFFDLELLEYPIGLGREVFHSEKVSFEMLGEISSTLKGYLQILSEYGITQYKIVATTALREAKNCAFIVDQLKIQNDVIVEDIPCRIISGFTSLALPSLPSISSMKALSVLESGSRSNR